VNLAGRTSLDELGAAIRRAAVLICNDSGPSHIAYALGTPSVTLFGPGNLPRWAPLDTELHTVLHKGVDCSPCMHRECPIDHRCLLWISVDEVVDAASSLLPPRRMARETATEANRP
jgi:ADP-heptose:LPS heptosyltransferase